jgi:serine/threonine protein kinase
MIDYEAVIHKTLKHPFILEFRGYRPGNLRQHPAIVSEVAGNGSLADHLRSANCLDQSELGGSTRIAKIVTEIVLAMRFIHSREIVHHDLRMGLECPHS